MTMPNHPQICRSLQKSPHLLRATAGIQAATWFAFNIESNSNFGIPYCALDYSEILQGAHTLNGAVFGYSYKVLGR